MSKKICTGCNIKGEVLTRAKWVTKSGRKEHPPKTFVPLVNNLVTVDIQRPLRDAGKFVYFFAAESKSMLEIDNKFKKKISPKDAYDDFENRGICQLDSNGFCRVVISRPVEYHVKEDNKTYSAHLHYKLSTKDNKWGKTNYTIQI